MMITRNNVISEYPKIDQKILPAVLKQSEFDFLSENMDLYGEDETIDEFIDTFIKKLNEIISKKASQNKTKANQSKKKTKSSNVKASQSKSKTTTSKRKVNQSKKKTTSSKSKANKSRKQASVNKSKAIKTEQVNSVNLQHSILKSFYLILDKEVPASRLLSLYRKIEKAALEKKIRKKDKHSTVIENISKIIADEYNKGKNTYIITISVEDKQKIKEIAYSERVRKSVALLKRFANIVGKETEEKRDRLINSIEKAKIPTNDPYYKQIKDILQSLKSKKTINVSQSELRGLLSGFAVPAKARLKKKDEIDFSEIVSSTDLKGIEFETIDFIGKWSELIGKPSNPFYLMIYGSPGSGKSTLTIQFAKYLTKHHGFKVLFFAKEEGVSKTMQEKLQRFNAFDKNLFISASLPNDLNPFDVLIIDSVNDARLLPEDIENIQKNYPHLSLIMIFQSTKDGQFRGYNTWEHWVQTVIEVKNGKACTGKNRFGAKTEIDVF